MRSLPGTPTIYRVFCNPPPPPWPQAARDATLAAKKSEHRWEGASAALEVAKGELASCQLVVDEGSEAARLREQVRKCPGGPEGVTRGLRVWAGGRSLSSLCRKRRETWVDVKEGSEVREYDMREETWLSNVQVN